MFVKYLHSLKQRLANYSQWTKYSLPPMFVWLQTKNSFCILAIAKLLQSCLTLCDPIDGSPPGSAVPGILQARVLEWGAIAFLSHLHS